jgi:hypothetical protein
MNAADASVRSAADVIGLPGRFLLRVIADDGEILKRAAFAFRKENRDPYEITFAAHPTSFLNMQNSKRVSRRTGTLSTDLRVFADWPIKDGLRLRRSSDRSGQATTHQDPNASENEA